MKATVRLTTADLLPHGIHERRDGRPPDRKATQPKKSKPAPATPDKKLARPRPDEHDWREVEEEIRLEFNCAGGEVDLEVRAHVHAFGAEACVEDIVETLLPKVQQSQRRSRGKVVLGHKHTIKKLTQYVSWWLAFHLGRSGRPQTPAKPTSPYTPEQGRRGRDTQAQRADGRAAQAKALHSAGVNVKAIASHLSVSLKCVYRWLKRTISAQQLKAAIAVLTSACTAFCTYLPIAVVRLLKTKTARARQAQKRSQATAPPLHGENRTWYTNRSGRIVRLAFAIPDHMIRLQGA